MSKQITSALRLGRGVAREAPWGRLAVNAFLLSGALIMAFPFLWMVLTTFKSPIEQAASPPTLLPLDWTFSNYPEVFRLHPMVRYFMNSLIVALATTFGGVLFAALAGYAFAKHKFWGERWFFFAVISGMVFPHYLFLIPRFLLIRDMGLIDSLLAIILPQIFTAYGVFWLRQYMLSIPDELLDSARVDGASEWKIFWRIVLPQAVPALAALAIFQFRFSWEDLLWPLIVINSDSNKTMPIGVASYYYTGGTFADFGLILTAATVATLPVIVVYLLLQRHFFQGVILSGLKE
jgi:multiple sugar transport system permease protein